MKFGCAICIFLNSENLICRTTDISNCFWGSLRLRDNESRLYIIVHIFNAQVRTPVTKYTLLGINIKWQTYKHLISLVNSIVWKLNQNKMWVLKGSVFFGFFFFFFLFQFINSICNQISNLNNGPNSVVCAVWQMTDMNYNSHLFQFNLTSYTQLIGKQIQCIICNVIFTFFVFLMKSPIIVCHRNAN